MTGCAFDLATIEVLHQSAIYQQAHARAHYIWSRVASFLLATIAVTGALAGGSALTDSRTATAVLGVTTALLTGLNSGLRPVERAAQHQQAATAYNAIVHAVQRLLIERERDPEADLVRLEEEFVKIDGRFTEAESKAPSVSPRDAEFEEADRRTKFLLGETLTADQVLAARAERRKVAISRWRRRGRLPRPSDLHPVAPPPEPPAGDASADRD